MPFGFYSNNERVCPFGKEFQPIFRLSGHSTMRHGAGPCAELITEGSAK